ncbi:mannonate dehydratase [Suicoccus acidiformans]|uniref:Mannonate dehydratase n=1 Tax=Suicoccus acidiformans TaxID=2036206 RepID=A0A347WIH3_9LACT|nr:mannonate dehydratase [Suicoccus acidiformans]AXY24880.1 mannonate dehydratase [Suicoccus acidiformans]
MKWSFRWYGEGDNIPLQYVKQIPEVTGVVGTLLNKLPGDVWEVAEINELKQTIEAEGMNLDGIESVSIHDAIKAGTDERDYYIDNYIQTIRNLAECDVKLICYSFKPIFGWLKTNLNYEDFDGSLNLVYDQSIIDNMEPSEVFSYVQKQTKGFALSGWEEERLAKFNSLLSLYDGITREKLFDNYAYFIDKVIPVCDETGVKMAIHPDDPPWEIFGFPRITKNLEDLKAILSLSDSPNHGLTLCTGSLGADPDNDLVQIIKEVGDRINFVHFRNVEFLGEQKFKECAHYSIRGNLDMYAIMEALVEVGFNGVIRPDHGRTIWGENARPGYGLYDRAIGIGYMQGLHEAILKNSK